jgi:DNA-binding response OmpR family regulator
MPGYSFPVERRCGQNEETLSPREKAAAAHKSITDALEARDFQIIHVDNPEEGFQSATKEKPDLIILDVMFGEKQETQGLIMLSK